jgi:hypothetical protein
MYILKGHSITNLRMPVMSAQFIDPNSQLKWNIGRQSQSSSIETDQKQNIVLPTKHQITRLIVSHEYTMELYAGPTALLDSV